MLNKSERLLGRIALESGMIGPDALARAIEEKEQAPGGGPGLLDVLVAQGAITRSQEQDLLAKARDAARRRAAVRWAVAQAGKTPDTPGGELDLVVEGEGAWAGVRDVELRPAGAAPVETARAEPEARVAPSAPAVPRSTPERAGAEAAPAAKANADEELAIAKIAMERGLLTLAEVRESLQAQADFAAIGRPLSLGQVLVKRRAVDVDTFIDIAREARERAVRCPGCGALSVLPAARTALEGAFEGRCPKCGGVLPIRGRPARSSPSPLPPLPARTSTRGVPQRPSHHGGGARRKEALRVEARPDPDAAHSGAIPVAVPVAELDAPAAVVEPAPPQTPPAAGARRGESLTGQTFGRYDVQAEIARGGMGIVYRAKDRSLGRVVALKVLRDGVAASEKQVRRFKRETEAAAKLRHPNIVPVYDVGCDAGRHYFTMEYVDGLPLDELIRRGPVDVRRALEITEQIALAMHHAHEAGIIHRDLKPANVILDRRGVPRITDFGLAKNIDRVSAMTKTGAAVGTPFYMPPEQAKGDARRIDRRVDVYAMGVILYEMLTSELPFDGETTLDVYRRILEDEAPPPSRLNKACDPDTDLIVTKALSKERDDRHATALELAEEIRRKLDGKPLLARRPGAIAVAARRVRRSVPALLAGAVVALVLAAMGGALFIVRAETEKRYVDDEARRELKTLEDGVAVSLGKARAAYQSALERLVEHPPRPAQSLASIDEALAELSRCETALSHPDGLRYRDRNAPRAKELLARLRSEDLFPLSRDLLIARAQALTTDTAALSDAGLEQALAALDRALAIDPGGARAQLERGRVLLALGRLDEAVDALTRAIDHAKGSPELRADALLARGDALAATSAHEKALADFETLEREERAAKGQGPALFSTIDREPTRLALAIIHGAKSRAALGRADDALAALAALTEADGGLYPAWIAASDVRRLTGDLAGAKEAALAAMKVRGERPDGYCALGQLWLELGRNEDALRELRAALERDARFAPARLYSALARDRVIDVDRGAEGGADGARALLEEVERGAGDRELRATASLFIAGLFRERYESGFEAGAADPAALDAAIAACDRAIAADPRLAPAFIARGRLRLRAGEVDLARSDVTQASEIGADPAALAMAEGLLLMSGRDSARAAERFHEAVRRARLGFFTEAAEEEAHALADAGDRARARAAYATALSMEARSGDEPEKDARAGAAAAALQIASGPLAAARPDAVAAVFYRLGCGARDEAKKEPARAAAAIRAFARAAAIEPRHARAHLELARLLRAGRSNDAALAAASAAIRANPWFADALVERAGILLESPGNPARLAEGPSATALLAQADLDAALGMEPGRADALFARARALDSLGDRAGALLDLGGAIRAVSLDEGVGSKTLVPLLEQRARLLAADGSAAAALEDQARARALRGANRAVAEKLRAEAHALWAGNRLAEAADRLSSAIAEDSTYADAWYDRASVRFRLLDILGCVLDIARCLELDAHFADETFENASLKADAFDLRPVHDKVEELLKASPDDVSALFLRGLWGVVRLYQRKIRPADPEAEAALRSLDRVILLSPLHSFAYIGRAYLALEVRGDLARAERDVFMATELDKKSHLALYVTALVKTRKGDGAGALDALERARALGFRGFARLKADPGFAPLRELERWRKLVGP